MRYCPIIDETKKACANAYLSVCPELGKPGKCREVGIDESTVEPTIVKPPSAEPETPKTDKKTVTKR